VLSTQKGTCFFQRDKGWNCEKLIFIANTPVLEELIYQELSREIPEQLPEIEVQDIYFKYPDNTSISIYIDCLSTKTLQPFTFVYPYYRK
jgi:phage baseplate assembly protein W